MSYGWAKDAEALTHPHRIEINTGTPRSYLWIETDEDGNVELHLAQVDIGHVVVTDPTDEPPS